MDTNEAVEQVTVADVTFAASLLQVRPAALLNFMLGVPSPVIARLARENAALQKRVNELTQEADLAALRAKLRSH